MMECLKETVTWVSLNRLPLSSCSLLFKEEVTLYISLITARLYNTVSASCLYFYEQSISMQFNVTELEVWNKDQSNLEWFSLLLLWAPMVIHINIINFWSFISTYLILKCHNFFIMQDIVLFMQAQTIIIQNNY